MMQRRLFIFSMFLVVLLHGIAAAETGPATVCVSIAPQKEIVQQIGKDRVKIQVMVPPAASPATYEPKPRQMTALAEAAIYFSIGVPFEHVWLEKFAAANSRMKIVAVDQGIQKQPMAAHHHEDEEERHGHEDHEDHGDHGTNEAHAAPAEHLDPHIWTSPPLVLQQARTILAALQQHEPAHAAEYAANFERFAKEIQALHEELTQILADVQGAVFMTFHPSWGYFARTYGLRQMTIEIEGKSPKPSQLQEAIEMARQKKIKAIFVQPQFSAKSARLIARAIGAQVIEADPLAEDWADNLRRQAKQFKAALR